VLFWLCYISYSGIVIKFQKEKGKKEFFRLLRDEYSLLPGRTIQDITVEFLSKYAKEESLETAPGLFISGDLPTRRGAYKLMKALIQTQEDVP
jgi:hypothetical protein